MRADLVIIGFGHVGRRFAQPLEERREWLALDILTAARPAVHATYSLLDCVHGEASVRSTQVVGV
jgi:homoserine dehydrogenase